MKCLGNKISMQHVLDLKRENGSESPGAWIFEKWRLAWMSNPSIRSQLPILYRIFALYCDKMGVITPKRILGSLQFFRIIRRITRTFSLVDTARIKVEDRVLFVDLLDPRFVHVVHEVQSDSTQVLESLLHEGDTFIDVGANHGSFAIVASSLVGPDGHVCAFEPQPRLSALVQQSLQKGVSSHEVHQVALGNTPGEVPLYIPDDTSGSAGLFEEHSATHEHRRIDVKKRAFDEIVDWERYPGRLVLKLDVEGAEVPFLKGAEEMIDKRKPVIILEIHPGTLKASAHTREELKNILMKYGYETYSSLSTPKKKRPLSKLSTSEQRDVIIR